MNRSRSFAEVFAERLRTAREKKKWNQAQLAEQTGLQPSAVSHFETGNRAPSFENLRRLADALAVTTDYLLGRVEEPKASGPLVQDLFDSFKRMSAADQQNVIKFSAMLAGKAQTF